MFHLSFIHVLIVSLNLVRCCAVVFFRFADCACVRMMRE